MIDVGTTSAATLLLDDGTTITSGNLAIGSGSTLDIEKGATGPGATLDGVTVTGTDAVTVSGTIVTPASLIDVGTTSAATLLLDDGTTIAGGNLAIGSGSALDIEKGTTGPGATLDGVTVTGADAVTVSGTIVAPASLIDVGTTSAATLLLDDGTTITSGNLAIGSGSTLDIEKGTAGPGATLDGVTVGNGGTIDVGATASGAVLTLDDDTVISNGNLAIGNNSTLDIEKGATGPGATLDGVTVGNGGTIDVGTSSVATLLLDDGTTITGGNLAIGSNGTLDIEKGATGPGATLDGVTVGNGGTIDVGATASGAVLTLDNGTVISNGKLTIGGNSTLDIAKGTAPLGPGAPDATLDGVTVGNGGTIDVGTASVATLLLDDGTTIAGGNLATGYNGTLDIEKGATGPGATLDGVTVGNGGMIDVGATASGAVLTLDDDTVISNGNMTIGSGSTLDVENSVTGTGATLDGVNVINSGTIQVDPALGSTVTLVLDGGTTITGGTLLIHLPTSTTAEGVVEIAAGGATLDNVTVTNNNILTINSLATLKLDGGTAINGGAITGYGKIDVTGNSSINGTPVSADAFLSNGAVTVESGVTLTLDNVTATGTTITDPGTIKVGSGKTLTLAGTDTITGGQFTFGEGKVAQAGSGSVLLSGVSIGDLQSGNPPLTLTITPGSGSVALVSAAGLSVVTGVNGVVTVTGALADIETALNTGLTLGISAGTSMTLTMSLDDGAGDTAFRELTINSPQSGPPTFQITDASGAIRNANLIDVTGTTTLSSDSLFNGSSILKVEASALLKLAHTGTHGGTITDDGTIEITAQSGINNGDLNIGLTGVLLVDSGKLLTLRNSVVTGGTVTDNGTIEITSSSAINGAQLGNFQLTVDSGQTLTLDNTSITGGTVTDNGTIDVSGISSINGTTTIGSPAVTTNAILENGAVTVESGATLKLDNVTVTGTIFTDVATSSTIQIDIGDTLAFNGATINGGTLNVFGELDSTGTSLISGATITNTGIIDVTAGTLTIDATSTLDNTGTLETNGGKFVIGAGAVVSGTATVTIAGGGLADLVGTTTQTLNLNATFSGNGTLELDNPQHYGGTITGFGAGDTIDLTDLGYSSNETAVWNNANKTLTISNGTSTETLAFAGSYDQNSFALTADANGKTAVVASPAQASVSGLNGAGNAVEGDALTATLTDAQASGITYQWLDDGVAISGATGSSYTPTVNDEGKTLDVVIGFTDGIAEHLTALAGTVQVLQDGGFEAPNLGQGNYEYSPSGTPWVFSAASPNGTGGDGIANNASGFTSANPNAPEGDQVAFLQSREGSSGQTISQTFDTPAGNYAIDFDAAQRGNGNSDNQTFEVLLDGNVVGRYEPSGTNYAAFSTSTLAIAAGAHTLTFEALNSHNSTDATALIDDVTLVSESSAGP